MFRDHSNTIRIQYLMQHIRLLNYTNTIAQDKLGIHRIFFLFFHENICCGYSLKRLVEVLLMGTHSICFLLEKLSLIWSYATPQVKYPGVSFDECNFVSDIEVDTSLQELLFIMHSSNKRQYPHYFFYFCIKTYIVSTH